MLWGFRQIVLVLHILLAIIWAGGVLFIGWGVYPAFGKHAFVQKRQLLQALMQWTHKWLTAAGAGVVITGILLGTVSGPINQVQDLFSTRYGMIWLAALAIGTVTLLWGVVVGYRQSRKLFSNVSLWEQADNGNKKPLKQALAVIALCESVEVSGCQRLVYVITKDKLDAKKANKMRQASLT